MNVKVNLNIGPHSITLPNTPIEREQATRAAAKHLNERYLHYQTHYPKASQEQIWLYIALESATLLKMDIRDKALEPIEEKIKELNSRIGDVLSKKDNPEQE